MPILAHFVVVVIALGICLVEAFPIHKKKPLFNLVKFHKSIVKKGEENFVSKSKLYLGNNLQHFMIILFYCSIINA